MAVNYIDPAQGALRDSISRFGEGLALRLTQKQRREQSLRENPQQMQALAAAYRQAQAAGQGPAFLEGIGVRPEFGGQILAFQPNVQERTETAMLTAGTPEALVRAETGKANVEGDTAEGIIRRGLINLQQDNAVSEAILAGRSLSAQDLLRLPEERVKGEVAELGAKQQESRFGEALFRRRNEGDLARLTVDSEVLGERVRQSGFRLEQGTLESYKKYLDSLDPNSHEYQVALTGLRNPQQLAHIQFHENMKHEESLARISASGSDFDRLAETLKVQGAYQSALTAYRETISNDNLKGPQKEQLVRQHADNLNALRLIAEELQGSGAIFPIDAALGSIEDEDRINFTSRYFESEDMRGLLDYMIQDYANIQRPGGDPLTILKGNKELWGALSQRDREQLEKAWGDHLDELRARQESEASALGRQDLVEKAKGTINRVTGGATEKKHPIDQAALSVLGFLMDNWRADPRYPLAQKLREFRMSIEQRRPGG